MPPNCVVFSAHESARTKPLPEHPTSPSVVHDHTGSLIAGYCGSNPSKYIRWDHSIRGRGRFQGRNPAGPRPRARLAFGASVLQTWDLFRVSCSDTVPTGEISLDAEHIALYNTHQIYTTLNSPVNDQSSLINSYEYLIMGKRAQPDDGGRDFQQDSPGQGPLAMGSIMPNEPNLRRLGPENRGWGEKRTQSNPIPSVSNGLAVMDGQIRSTKPEMRNKSKIRRIQRAETLPANGSGVWDLRFGSFGLVSCFDIRISSFPHSGGRVALSSIAPNEPNFGVFGPAIGVCRESKANLPGRWREKSAGGNQREGLAIGLNLGYIWDRKEPWL